MRTTIETGPAGKGMLLLAKTGINEVTMYFIALETCSCTNTATADYQQP